MPGLEHRGSPGVAEPGQRLRLLRGWSTGAQRLPLLGTFRDLLCFFTFRTAAVSEERRRCSPACIIGVFETAQGVLMGSQNIWARRGPTGSPSAAPGPTDPSKPTLCIPWLWLCQPWDVQCMMCVTFQTCLALPVLPAAPSPTQDFSSWFCFREISSVFVKSVSWYNSGCLHIHFLAAGAGSSFKAYPGYSESYQNPLVIGQKTSTINMQCLLTSRLALCWCILGSPHLSSRIRISPAKTWPRLTFTAEVIN